MLTQAYSIGLGVCTLTADKSFEARREFGGATAVTDMNQRTVAVI